jgi:RimJ/RimL family protein N-acetyltransferase
MPPRLETPRLVLRQFAASDWDAFNPLLSDPEANRYMHFAGWTEDQRREWFEWIVTNAQQPDAATIIWAITRKDAGDVIGYFGIETFSDAADPGAGEREFGYLLTRALWNHGYMTETLRAVLAHEFGSRGTPQLRATCNVANLASARVMEKAGMRREKTVLDAESEGNEAQHHYTITKAEYEARS